MRRIATRAPLVVALVALAACRHRRAVPANVPADAARDASTRATPTPPAPRVLRVTAARLVATDDGGALLVVAREPVTGAADGGAVDAAADVVDAGADVVDDQSPAERAAERALAALAGDPSFARLLSSTPEEPAGPSSPLRGSVVSFFAVGADAVAPLPAPPARAPDAGLAGPVDWFTFDGSDEPVVVAEDPLVRATTFAWTRGAWAPASAASVRMLATGGVPFAVAPVASGARRDAVTLRCTGAARDACRPAHVPLVEPRTPRPGRLAHGFAPVPDPGDAPGVVLADARGAEYLLRGVCTGLGELRACALDAFVARAPGAAFRRVRLGATCADPTDLDDEHACEGALAVGGGGALAAFVRLDGAATTLEAWRFGGANGAPVRVGPPVATVGEGDLSNADVVPLAARADPPAVLWIAARSHDARALCASELRDGRWSRAEVPLEGEPSALFARDDAWVVVASGAPGAPPRLLRYANGAWSAGPAVP